MYVKLAYFKIKKHILKPELAYCTQKNLATLRIMFTFSLSLSGVSCARAFFSLFLKIEKKATISEF